MARLYSKQFASASFGGQSFEVKDGSVEVPEEAIAALVDHGFSTSPEVIEPEAPAAPDHAALGAELTQAKQELLEQAGVVDALQAERDALVARVAELEKAAATKVRKV